MTVNATRSSRREMKRTDRFLVLNDDISELSSDRVSTTALHCCAIIVLHHIPAQMLQPSSEQEKEMMHNNSMAWSMLSNTQHTKHCSIIILSYSSYSGGKLEIFHHAQETMHHLTLYRVSQKVRQQLMAITLSNFYRFKKISLKYSLVNL